MRKKAILVLVAALLLGLATAAPASAFGVKLVKPVVQTAYLYPLDSSWSEYTGNGWRYDNHDPGTPIPSAYRIALTFQWYERYRETVEMVPLWYTGSATITGPGGVVFTLSEVQFLNGWTEEFHYGVPVPAWNRQWEIPVGTLAPGRYRLTYRERITTAFESWGIDENNEWYSITVEPGTWTSRSTFTVQ
jgi:hypothetical protein